MAGAHLSDRRYALGQILDTPMKEIEPNGFQQKVEDERYYQTAISDFQNFENFEK